MCVFWLLLPEFNFWKGDWALGYVSTQIWDFPNISWFPKILSLKSFGNWWGNSCTKFAITIWHISHLKQSLLFPQPIDSLPFVVEMRCYPVLAPRPHFFEENQEQNDTTAANSEVIITYCFQTLLPNSKVKTCNPHWFWTQTSSKRTSYLVFRRKRTRITCLQACISNLCIMLI